MKYVLLLAALLGSSALAQYSGTYSERSQQLRRDSWEQEKQSDIARTRQINQSMLDAAAAYAQYKGTSIPQNAMSCKTRRDIYWYGFNPPADDDAWGAIRYQYCEFPVGNEGCRIGMSWSGEPVHVYCLGTDGVRTSWQVSANGQVSRYVSGEAAAKKSTRRR